MPAQSSEPQTVRVPLVGTYNTREFDTAEDGSSGIVGVGIVGTMIVGNDNIINKDQRFLNCIPTKTANPLTGAETYYIMKRPGVEQHTQPATTNPGKYIVYWGNKTAGAAVVSAFGNTNSTIYVDTTSIGSITGECIYMEEILYSTTPAIVIQSDDNTLWYYVEDAVTSFTGDTNTNAIIDNISDTSGIYVGQAISGTDIPADTRVLSIDSATQITIDKNATGTTPSVSFTLEKLAVVDDTDYPGNASKTILPGCVSMNGYLYVMDSNGVIYNSDLNVLTSWTADASIQTLQYHDKGKRLIRYRNLIAALSNKSVEFFSDVGNPSGTPLLNNLQATVKIGTSASYAVTSVDDALVWVSSTEEGGAAVYMYDNYQTKKISIPVIEEQLAYYGSTDVLVNSARIFGRAMVFIKISSASPLKTYVYCIDDGMWHEWSASYEYFDHFAVSYTGTNDIYMISEDSDSNVAGQVWKLDASNILYTDNGSNYEMLVQTSKIDINNSKLKRLHRLYVVGDTKYSSGNINVSWSDDDYFSFSSARTVDIMVPHKYLNACGQFRRRAFKISYTGASSLRLEALELSYSEGTH